MYDYKTMLEQYPNGVFATQNGDKVRTRVFKHQFTIDGRVYFTTSNEKPVYREMQANPNVSFCVYAPDFKPVMSVNGKAVFVDDRELKQRTLDNSESLRGMYQTADNPVFELFYIDVEEVDTFSFVDGAQTYKK